MISQSRIPLVQTLIGDAEIEAVVEVLRSGQLASGPKVAQFEGAFADAVGVRHAVAVNSGTAAIHCALDACSVGAGDEVITTPFTFAATATPILMQRARPVFVDIHPETFNVDIGMLACAVTSRTKAAIVVDLFGLPADNTGLEQLNDRGIVCIEDACQAIGARRRGVAAGALGNIGCFSLYATKNIMAGEGGILVTDNAAFAKQATRFRQHGQGERYEYLSLGFNYRMTDIAAAIGFVQMQRLADITAARRRNAAQYDRLLSGIPGVTLPHVPENVEHAYHQYSIVIEPQATPNGRGRDEVRAALANQGIGTGIYYPTPLHQNPLFKELGFRKGSFPVAERIASQILALPVHPLLESGAVHRVAHEIREILHAT